MDRFDPYGHPGSAAREGREPKPGAALMTRPVRARPPSAVTAAARALCTAAGLPPGAERATATAIELTGDEPPREILLLPAGRIVPRTLDGRDPWTNDDPDAIAALSRELGQSVGLPIDYNHQGDLTKETGGEAPAAGWIKRLAVRGGEVWGEVEWTPRAAAAIAAREYRFISPTFYYDKTTRRVLLLTGAALTNDPALAMRALLTANREKGAMTEEELRELREKLGLAADASAGVIIKAAAAARTAQAAIDGLRTPLGVPADADAAQVAEAVKAQNGGVAAIAAAAGLAAGAAPADIASAVASARSGGDPDPAKFVPRAEFDAAKGRLKDLEDGNAKAAATAAVDRAVREGRVAPASKEWALDYARKDPKGFEAYVKDAPVIVRPGSVMGDGPPVDADAALDAEQKAFCSRMGISEEAFKKSRASLARSAGREAA